MAGSGERQPRAARIGGAPAWSRAGPSSPPRPIRSPPPQLRNPPQRIQNMPENQTRDFPAVTAKVEPEARKLIAQYPDGNARSALLPILHAFQNVEGWVSPEAMERAAVWVGVPLSVVESTASFYTLFHRRPVGKYMLQPCRNLSCILGGAGEIMTYFREQLGIGHNQTTADGVFSYEEAECLAACDRAPCMQVNLQFFYDLTKADVDTMLAAMRAGTFEVPPRPQSMQPGPDWRVAQESGRKSPGAQSVSDPNDPGGFGDASGDAMIARLAKRPQPIDARPTNERLVADGAARLANPSSNGSGH
jgi:NADH-quinone oxidoreductase subunit E